MYLECLARGFVKVWVNSDTITFVDFPQENQEYTIVHTNHGEYRVSVEKWKQFLGKSNLV